jgi:hypothetical protein
LEKVLNKELCALVDKNREQLVKQLIGADFTYTTLLNTISPASSALLFDAGKLARDLNLGQLVLVIRCSEPPHTYALYNALPPIQCDKSYLPFAAIGRGAAYASAALRIEHFAESSSLSQTLYQVYLAKKASEMVYGVGEPTDMAIMTERGYQDVPEETIQVLEQIRKSRKQALLKDDETQDITRSLASQQQ